MIKVIIKGDKKIYPCLKISELETVILFTTPGTGTVLLPGKATNNIGDHSTTWQDDLFKFFSGEICLSNQ